MKIRIEKDKIKRNINGYKIFTQKHAGEEKILVWWQPINNSKCNQYTVLSQLTQSLWMINCKLGIHGETAINANYVVIAIFSKVRESLNMLVLQD